MKCQKCLSTFEVKKRYFDGEQHVICPECHAKINIYDILVIPHIHGIPFGFDGARCILDELIGNISDIKISGHLYQEEPIKTVVDGEFKLTVNKCLRCNNETVGWEFI